MVSRSLFIAIALSLTAFAANGASPTPGSGIAGTAHDFSSSAGNPKSFGTALLQSIDGKGAVVTRYTGAPYIDPATGTQGFSRVAIGLCEKCHSLRYSAASTGLPWNPALPTARFVRDDPLTTTGTPYPRLDGDTFNGPTILCLACHDGAMASGDGKWFSREAFAGTGLVAASGARVGEPRSTDTAANPSVTHPIAMPYPYRQVRSSYNFLTNGDTDFANWVADPSVFGIRLYSDDGAGAIKRGPVSGRTGIECSSCHDVHNGAGVRDVYLLTFTFGGPSQTGGEVCAKCHHK